MAAIGFNILPQRRDLERMALHDNSDRAMLDTGRHRLETGFICQPHRILRQMRRCQIDIADLGAEQRVAHCATHDTRLAAIAVQRLEQALQRLCFQPVRLAGNIHTLAQT